MKRDSQAQRLLKLLESGEWVSLPQILNLRIASFTRRITDLRRLGKYIICEKTWVDGECHSRYKLVSKEVAEDWRYR